MSEDFRGELYGEGFTVLVQDFIVREDHIAFEFLVKEPGYGDYKFEGKAREYTEGTMLGSTLQWWSMTSKRTRATTGTLPSFSSWNVSKRW